MKVKSKKFAGVYIYKSSVRKGDECYYISYWYRGKKTNEKVGWKSEGYTQAEANKIRMKRIHAIRHGNELPIKAKKLALNDIWEMFHKTIHLAGNSGTALLIEQRYNRWIKGRLGSIIISSIDSGMIQRMFDAMEMEGMAQGTQYHYYSILNRIYKYAIGEGLFTGKNPMNSVKKPVNNVIRKRWLTKEEASKLLSAMNLYGTNLYLQTAIMLFTGMRISEVMNIKGRDISFETDQILVKGKGRNGGKERFCEMNEFVKNLLLQHPLQPGEKLFKNGFNRKAWMKVVNDLGLNDGVEDNNSEWLVTPHTLRHTFGSWLAQSGTDIRVSKELLGHSKIETTMRYEKLAPRSGTKAVEGLVKGVVL